MNQKEYELIAKNLKELKNFVDKKTGLNSEYNNGKYDTWYIFMNNICNDLARNYKTFDRKKFLKACGL